MTDIEQAILQGIETLRMRFDRAEARLASIDGRVSSIEGRMSTLESVVADLDIRIKTWPDMHDLAAAATLQLAHARELKAAVEDVRAQLAKTYQGQRT